MLEESSNNTKLLRDEAEIEETVIEAQKQI
jgi:hypothetical protein